MFIDKIVRSLVWGISTAIGLTVAESVYRTSTNQIDKRKLIGDCEIISEESEVISESATDA